MVSLIVGTIELAELKRLLGVPQSGNIKNEVLPRRIYTRGTDRLMIRCFFLVNFSKLLFSAASNNITGKDVVLTKDIDNFGDIKWCKAVVDDLREATRT